MSKVIQVSPHWNYEKIRKIFIFGDSYSSVGHFGLINSDLGNNPTATHPLGIGFPGTTWNEPGLPNWVGHFLVDFCPVPRFPWPTSHPDPSSYAIALEAWSSDPLLVYNYSKGGDNTLGVKRQVERSFLPDVGRKPEYAPWTMDNSLFVTEVGINDCAYATQHEWNFNVLREMHEKVYEAGGRNFIFMDVPPTTIFPGVHGSSFVDRARTSYVNWNSSLDSLARSFAKAHPDATVLIFGLSKCFADLIQDPELYGFQETERHKKFGQIWYDHIHPTSKVHEVLAGALADFLSEVGLQRN